MTENPTRFDWERAMRSRGLRRNLRLFLMTLATYMDADGSNCYPSADTVCKDLGIKRGSFFEWQTEAIESGWLIVHSKKGQPSGADGRGRTNLFEPVIPDATQSVVDPTVSASTPSGTHPTVSKSTQSGERPTGSPALDPWTQSGHRGSHSRVPTADTVGWGPDATNHDHAGTTQKSGLEVEQEVEEQAPAPVCAAPWCCATIGTGLTSKGLTMHETCALQYETRSA